MNGTTITILVVISTVLGICIGFVACYICEPSYEFIKPPLPIRETDWDSEYKRLCEKEGE